MTLQADPNAIDDAIFSLLSNDAGILAAATGGVYEGVANEAALTPFAVYTIVSDNPEFQLNQSSALQTLSVLVKGVGYTRSEAGSVLAACDAALNMQPITIAGYATVSLKRNGSGQRFVDENGFYNAVYYYQLVIQKG